MTPRMGLSARFSAALWRRSVLHGLRENIRIPAGSPSASTSSSLLTVAFVHSSLNVIEQSLPSPLHTPRRYYGSGAASSNGGVLSLADLAKVFQQLSSDKERRVQQDHGSQSGGGDATEPTTTIAAAASLFGSPQEIDRGDGAPWRSEPASQRRSASSADVSSGSTPTSLHTFPRLGKRPRTEAVTHQPLISLSRLYAQRLTTLTEAQLCTELESRLGKFDYSSIMQCLHEVVRRLSPVSTTSSLTNAAADGDSIDARCVKRHRRVAGKREADAEDVAMSAARALMANHRFLTAILSALNRMDLCVMEAEMNSSPQNVSAAPAAGLGATPTAKLCADPQTPLQQQQQHHDGLSLPETPFSARLCRLLLQWLSREVSRMDATMSLQVLHLLAQQRLFHGEAVLETLVDSIVVHLERCGSVPAAATQTEPNCRAFTLEAYSLLFDALARFQAQLLRLSYLRQSTERERHVARPSAAKASDGRSVEPEDTGAIAADVAVITDFDTDPCLASAAAAVRRRALETSRHPVANCRLFHHLAEALSLELMRCERGRLCASMADAAADSIGPADTSARLIKMNATSFLFLTRALSKLQWWHDGLAAALAAPLTGYVRAHPESALVVVRLVGRREHRSGDVALLEALQDGLLTLLLRRRSALKAGAETVETRRRSRLAGMDGDAGVNGAFRGLVVRGALQAGNEAAGESPHRLAEVPTSDAKRARAPARVGIDDCDHRESEWGKEAGEEDEEADMRLLSTTALETHCKPRELLAPDVSTVASTPRAPASTQCGAFPALPQAKSASDSAASLTLIDLHALPDTIEALCRFHVRTLVVMPPSRKAGAGAGTSGDDVRARLVRRMQELLSLVLDDTSRGITSVDAIARGLSSVFLSRVLLTLLEATVQLQQAWGTSGPDVPSMHRGEHQSTATAHIPHHPLVIELAYAWMVQVMRSRPPPLPPPASHTEKHTAAAAARYHRIASSGYWRRAVVVHDALLKAGLICCTRLCMASASGPGALRRASYYMPDDALCAAPRVNAAVQHAKTQLQAERQRDAAEREEAEEQEREQHAAAPRYASASIRASSQRRRSPAASSSSLSPHHQHRRSTAVQPVRTADVFASYTRALSRLL